MTPQLQAAVAHLRRYFQDELSPDDAAMYLATMMAQPPAVLMNDIGIWSNQESIRHAIPVSEYLLCAMRKIYVIGQLDLLDREAIANYLDRVTSMALQLAPDEQKEKLRQDLTVMRASGSTKATRVVPLVAPPKITAPPVPRTEEEEENAAIERRLSLILDQLHRPPPPRAASTDPNAAAIAAETTTTDVAAQYLTMAASSAKDSKQLNQYLDQIKPLAGKEGNVFVILGGAIPSWDISGPAAAQQKAPAQVDAMERIMDLSTDPTLAQDRLRELVLAAVQKFNEGALAAAIWMFSVAEDSINEKKVDAASADRIRAEAAEKIDSVQLRKYVDTRRRHAALRTALNFFPSLAMQPLFHQLRGERRPERRRWLLALIETHTTNGRNFAIDELEKELARPDVDTYYLRNLIYLTHRIPIEGEPTEREIRALGHASQTDQFVYVVKEAATALGQLRTDAAVGILARILEDFEPMLIRGDTRQPAGELLKLIDRTASALARIGTPPAIAAVVRHGLMNAPQLGDTRARLDPLGMHDLSFVEDSLSLLLKTLRDEIPGKLLGRILTKSQDGTVHLINAVSGTLSREVDEILVDIARRFPDQPIGLAAGTTLEKRTGVKVAPPKPAEPVATLTGELEFFGLPSVLQSLADMRAAGMLTITGKHGALTAKLLFLDGKYLNGQFLHLRGFEALYEVLERPMAGKFAFIPHPPEKLKSNLEPETIMPLLLEGMRRHDELQQMKALVPDDLPLTRGTAKPTPHEEEKDPILVREIWTRAASGSPVGEWANQLTVDSYRIRRLLTHWLEKGALVRT